MNTTSKVSTSRRRAHDVFDKKALALGIALALSAGTAHAVESAQLCTAFTSTADTGGNFTMLNPLGGITGGTNDLVFTWTGTKFDATLRAVHFCSPPEDTQHVGAMFRRLILRVFLRVLGVSAVNGSPTGGASL